MKKIFIVDDDALITKVYRDMFEMEGYAVESATDGEAAMEKLKTMRPDLVLLDLFLPKVPGIVVLRQIRSDEATKSVPVIVFSNAYLAKMVEAAWKAGASNCLTKSDCSPEQLLEAVQAAIGVVPAAVDGAPEPAAGVKPVTVSPAPAPAPPPPPPPPAPTIVPRDPTLAAAGPAPAPTISPPPYQGNVPSPVTPFPAPGAAQPGPGLGGYQPAPAPSLGQPGLGGFSSPPLYPPPMPAAGYGVPPPPVASPFGGYGAPAMGGQGYPGSQGMGMGMGTRSMHAGPIAVQAELRQNFVAGAPQFANELRARMQGIATASGQAILPHLYELHQRVHAVTGAAGAAGFNRVAKLTSALEALLRELFEDPEFISPSTQRTTSHAVELLATMLEQAALMQQIEPPMPPLLLAVDDEIISRRALVAALDLACLRVVSLEDPFLAQRVATENPFDLIFLDVEMPGKTGFELCAEIRQLPTNQSTPVVFVTGLNGFEARARSTMSGGNDLIAKPFLPIELAVKAITYLTKSQLKPVTRGTWGT